MNTPTSSSPGAKDGSVAVWGAFWMLGIDVNDPYVGWPNSEEIDIMENIGYSWWFSSSLHSPGYSGGANANYFQSYIDQVWANNKIDEKIVPKPTPFMNFKDGNITDLNAALQRHMADQPGTFTLAGKLVNPNFWPTKPASSFYLGGAANYYAKYWHAHGIGGYAYGFPYDDVGSYSTYVTCAKLTSLSVAIGW
jgi:Beta-1,3-glucanase/Glycosyl hydrolases family 16